MLDTPNCIIIARVHSPRRMGGPQVFDSSYSRAVENTGNSGGTGTGGVTADIFASAMMLPLALPALGEETLGTLVDEPDWDSEDIARRTALCLTCGCPV